METSMPIYGAIHHFCWTFPSPLWLHLLVQGHSPLYNQSMYVGVLLTLYVYMYFFFKCMLISICAS